MPTPNLIGQQIHHYEILSHLGGGGMGVVYKAKDTKLGRTVALKFLAPQLTSDPDLKKRFVQEAKAASALDHPNIGTIFEINETDDGQLFIAMAYYEGETLKDKIAQGPISPDQALDYAAQIAKGLAKAHKANIVHRDIKPANILITEDNTIKIVDFGLAKMTGETQLTKEGSTIGTVAYMSPEQLKGQEVSHQTDIWSIGVVLYEMVTGKRPFNGEYEHAVIYGILHDNVELPTNIPENVHHALGRLLQRDPDKRYAYVNELLHDLGHSSSSYPSIQSTSRSGWRRVGIPLMFTAILLVLIGGLWMMSRSLGGASQGPLQPVETRLTFTGKAFAPAISPDGELIAYLEATSDTTGRIVLQEILSGARPLEILPQVHHSRIVVDGVIMKWSPDGKKLGIKSKVEREDGRYEIQIYSRLGQYIKSVLTQGWAFSWSPDASALVTTSGDSLYFINIQTSSQEKISLPNPVFGLDWSPSRSWIAQPSFGEPGSLFFYNKEGTLIGSSQPTDRLIMNPMWGKEGERLFFNVVNSMDVELHMLEVPSGNNLPADSSVELYSYPGLALRSSISERAGRLVYENVAAINNYIRYTIDAPGASNVLEGEMLTNSTSLKWGHQISDNGEEISFMMQSVTGADLYTISKDGGDLRQRTFTQNTTIADMAPGRINRHGDKALMIGSTNDTEALIRVDLESGEIFSTEIQLDGYFFGSDYTWDGADKITYSRNVDGRFTLAEYDMSTENVEVWPAVDSLPHAGRPYYSPDGNQIAFVSQGIRVYSKQNSSLRHLYKVNDDSEALYPIRWSSDGAWIYAYEPPFHTGLNRIQVVKISVVDGEIVPLATILGSESLSIDIAPDGSYIIDDLKNNTSDIWMLENFIPEVN